MRCMCFTSLDSRVVCIISFCVIHLIIAVNVLFIIHDMQELAMFCCEVGDACTVIFTLLGSSWKFVAGIEDFVCWMT